MCAQCVIHNSVLFLEMESFVQVAKRKMQRKGLFSALLLLGVCALFSVSTGALTSAVDAKNAPDHTCFGLAPNNVNVCSSQGRCFVQDTCVCDYGWFGDQCEQVVEVNAYTYTLNTTYLSAPLDIATDGKGIPHFPSAVDGVVPRKDVLYAQGYHSAKLRLWEYTMNRAIVQGQSAKLLGSSLVNTDINFRIQQYYASAQAQWNSGGIAQDVQNDLTWFTDGINAYITLNSPSSYSTQMKAVLPGMKPALFGPVDILSMQKLAISTLAQNVGQEFARERTRLAGNSLERVMQLHPPAWKKGDVTILSADDLNLKISDAQADAVEAKWNDNSAVLGQAAPNPLYTAATSPISNTVSSLRRRLLQAKKSVFEGHENVKVFDIDQDPEFQKFMNYHEGASNSETIAKKLSREHAAIVANDPHVSLSMASFWDVRVVGGHAGYYVFFSPYQFGGQTDNLLHAMTSGAVDTQDVYRMVDGPNGGYMYNGVEYPYNVRYETVTILNFNATTGAPYYTTTTIPCFDTILGPVVNLLRGFPLTGTKYVEHGLVGSSDPKASYLEALRGIEFASNCRDFITAAKKINTFGLSLSCAEKDGNGKISYALGSGIPVRVQGHTGAMPVPGDGRYSWMRLLSENEKPSAYDIKKGYVLTHNNRVVPNGYPYLLNIDTALSIRAQRAEDILQEKLSVSEKITATDMRALQIDTKSYLFLSYLPLFQRVLPVAIAQYPLYAPYFNMLASYDGAGAVGDEAMSLFEAVRGLSLSLTAPQGAPAINPLAPPTLMGKNDTICAQSAPFTNCDDYLVLLVKNVVDGYLANYGIIPKWGQTGVVGKYVITNVPLSMNPATAAKATVILPGGPTYGLFVGVYNPDAKLTMSSAFGSSLRIIASSSLDDHVLLSIPGGNDEEFLSPFYANLAPYYANGTYAVISV